MTETESGSESGPGDETGGSDVEYGAVAVPGGLDRIFIWRRDTPAEHRALLIRVGCAGLSSRSWISVAV